MLDATGHWIGTALRGLQHVERELTLFALFWFLVGLADELAIDCAWAWQRLVRGRRAARLPAGFADTPLRGAQAVFVPAWREAAVIGHTVTHMLAAWPQRGLRLYVGCYANDAATIAAAAAGAGADPRVRIVIHGRAGPTTKADCLNRLFAAMEQDEARAGTRFRGVILHDAEDMVHPAALAAIDAALDDTPFVQLPVRPEMQPDSPWIAGHYADEFTESHAKTMVVRDALGAALPAAGVGCGFARAVFDGLVRVPAQGARVGTGGSAVGPFAADCLTEDYELGLLVARSGARGRFLRLRDADGSLVATRSYFPARLHDAVRQKARWVHGIAFQGWDRLGWGGHAVDLWMTLRDRRGPLTALVLAAAYALVLVEGLLALATVLGWQARLAPDPVLQAMLAVSLAGLLWRTAVRACFTAHEYGVAKGRGRCCAFPSPTSSRSLPGARR